MPDKKNEETLEVDETEQPKAKPEEEKKAAKPKKKKDVEKTPEEIAAAKKKKKKKKKKAAEEAKKAEKKTTKKKSSAKNEFDMGITKEGVAEATGDLNTIYKEGAATAKELKEAFDDISQAFNFGDLFKKR